MWRHLLTTIFEASNGCQRSAPLQSLGNARHCGTRLSETLWPQAHKLHCTKWAIYVTQSTVSTHTCTTQEQSWQAEADTHMMLYTHDVIHTAHWSSTPGQMAVYMDSWKHSCNFNHMLSRQTLYTCTWTVESRQYIWCVCGLRIYLIHTIVKD